MNKSSLEYYATNNIGKDKHGITGIKCMNYELCNQVLPKSWWNTWSQKYLCPNCFMMFGTWGFGDVKHTGKGALAVFDNVECPICLQCKKSMSQPRCDHTTCIDCLRRCYFSYESREGEPEFPYSETVESGLEEFVLIGPSLEEEFMSDPYNPKWDAEYPLIKQHFEEWARWDEERILKYENEANLRVCPICRK